MEELMILENKISEMDKRAEMLKTREGMLQAEQDMITIFGALNACGYKLPDADERTMAKLWAATLKDYIAMFGTGVIKKAVVQFIQTDSREYKAFPKVSEIISEAKKLGVNPKAELARIKAQAEEEALVAKWKKELRDGQQRI